ncbi:MAG: nucleotidyltransferase domain-containing protein [Acidobacteria bacterium]|nr:nucleotidyltransferase domain-containing protein [Acidobacteriota bacterium]
MPEKSWNSVEVRFIDRDAVVRDLRQAVAEAKSRYPEIVRVYLFGSFVRGNWTADSDADLMVVVRRKFSGVLDSERSRYQIFVNSVPTDSLVYSETEFERLRQDPSSFPAQNLASAIEL